MNQYAKEALNIVSEGEETFTVEVLLPEVSLESVRGIVHKVASVGTVGRLLKDEVGRAWLHVWYPKLILDSYSGSPLETKLAMQEYGIEVIHKDIENIRRQLGVIW